MTSAVPFLLLALGAFVPLFFVSRAVYFGPRSRRLGNVALACGLAALFLPELATFDPSADGQLIKIAAILRGILAAVGLVLVLVAVRFRHDGGVGILRPTFAITFCLLHGMLAFGLWGIGNYMAPSAPWTYTAPDESFQITLPNARWRVASPSADGVALTSLLPPMRVSIKAHHDSTRADYLLNQQKIADRVREEAAPGEKVTKAEGTAGDRDLIWFTTQATDQGRIIYVSRGLVLNPTRRVLLEVHFEGHHRAKDEAGRTAEQQQFRDVAEQFFRSAQ